MNDMSKIVTTEILAQFYKRLVPNNNELVRRKNITGFETNNFIEESIYHICVNYGYGMKYSSNVYVEGKNKVFRLDDGDENVSVYVVFFDQRFNGILFEGLGATSSSSISNPEDIKPMDSELYSTLLSIKNATVKNGGTATLPDNIGLDVEYLENVSRRGIMEVWHTIIDYTKTFYVRATGSTVVARFAVNPYNPKPQNQFIVPSYEVTDGVTVRMTICSDAECTNVIAEEGEMIEFAAGTYVYVKYDLYYHSSVLGKKVSFAAKDAYGSFVGEKIETISPVTLFCESDYVTPMSGAIKVHSLSGGVLTAAGKKFGSDYKFLSKLTTYGVAPSGSGDISRVSVGKDFVINVNASSDNLGDTINIRVENAAVDVYVSNETSPEYKESDVVVDAYTKAESDGKFATKDDVDVLDGRVTAIEENGATLPDNVVTSESGEESFESVDETVAEKYGASVAKVSEKVTALGLELGNIEELDEEVASTTIVEAVNKAAKIGGGCDAYTKAESDERFADKIVDVSVAAKSHELMDGKKILSINKTMSVEPRYAKGKNLITTKPYLDNTNAGVSFEINEDGNVHVHGTATEGLDIRLQDEGLGSSFWSQYEGKSAVFCTYGIKDTAQIYFYLNDGTSKDFYTWTADTRYAEKVITIPSNIKYVRVRRHFARNEVIDNIYWAGLFLVEDRPQTCEESFEMDEQTEYVDTMYYNSVVTTRANTKEYVDKVAANSIGGLYITPEKFGAKGNGIDDDSDAIEAAMLEAATSGLPIKMYQTYFISRPIAICYDNMDVEIHNVICRADDCAAIQIQGQNNNIIINRVDAVYKGIEMLSPTKGSINNYIKVHTIKAKYGIHINAVGLCWQNTFFFTYIYGTGKNDGSVGILGTGVDSDLATNYSEFNFYGGWIQNVEWAYKGTGRNNKFYSVHIEGAEHGYWFVNEPYAVIFGGRYAEQVLWNNSTFLKIGNGIPYESNTGNSGSLYFYGGTLIGIDKIDLSDNIVSFTTDPSKYKEKMITSNNLGVINARIYCGYVQESNGAWTCISEKAFIYGKKLCCIPTYKTRKTITEATFDMRKNDNTTNCLPTTFVAGAATSVVYLHDSYIHFAINDFKVIQRDDKKIKIVNSDGKLVWDGTSKGAGTYHFEIEYSDEDGFRVGYINPKYDGEGELWYVNGEKQTLVDYNE